MKRAAMTPTSFGQRMQLQRGLAVSCSLERDRRSDPAATAGDEDSFAAAGASRLYLFQVGFTKQELLDFSGVRLKKLIDEFPDAGDLERSESGSAEVHELLFVERLTGFQLDESDEHLAQSTSGTLMTDTAETDA